MRRHARKADMDRARPAVRLVPDRLDDRNAAVPRRDGDVRRSVGKDFFA